jgi:hypothetical protein
MVDIKVGQLWRDRGHEWGAAKVIEQLPPDAAWFQWKLQWISHVHPERVGQLWSTPGDFLRNNYELMEESMTEFKVGDVVQAKPANPNRLSYHVLAVHGERLWLLADGYDQPATYGADSFELKPKPTFFEVGKTYACGKNEYRVEAVYERFGEKYALAEWSYGGLATGKVGLVLLEQDDWDSNDWTVQ